MSDEFKKGMEFAAQLARDCYGWYEGHGDKVALCIAGEIEARIKKEQTS